LPPCGGGLGRGVVVVVARDVSANFYPHPQPLPTRGRGVSPHSRHRCASTLPEYALMESTALQVEVWRGAASGRFQTFTVPRREHQTILDVVTEIQREQDATLSYRFACRVGMCGSCAMVVNGRPRWTCRTRVRDAVGDDGALRLEPLRNFTVVKDLAVEMTDFFNKWRDAQGFFEPGRRPAADFATIPPTTPARRAADEGIECIGCGICYSACDLVPW